MKKILLLFLLFKCLAGVYCQVNLPTGSATFSLPMFNWQDNKSRLNSTIALNYNSGNGLKTNEVASNVGQGWALIGGGVITRMQIGEPDDQKAYGATEAEDVKKYPAGYLYVSDTTPKGCPKQLTKYPLFKDKNHIYKQHNTTAEDRELDYFTFQFNGRAGMFVLAKGTNEAVIIGDSKVQVTLEHDLTLINQGIRTTISSFTIKDESGLSYRFARHGLTKVQRTSYCDVSRNQNLTQPKFKSNHVYYESTYEDVEMANPWVINSWYLTQIKDELTQRTVTFNYTPDRIITNLAGIDISYNETKDYSIVSYKTSIVQAPALSSILYPDQHAVLLNYGAERVDLHGDQVLASVDVKYQNRYISKFKFGTSYFILNRYGNPATPYERQCARLCLLSVTKFGVDLKAYEQPYRFDYFKGSNAADDFVPPPFSHLKDVWGFFNGSASVAVDNSAIPVAASASDLGNYQLKGLCFIRNGASTIALNPKSGYARNGLLKQISYPTGGALAYNYEQNYGFLAAQQRAVGGVHVSETRLTDGGYSNNCDNPIITRYNYVLNSTNESSLWGLELPLNSVTSSNHFAPEYKDYHFTLSNITGTCFYHFQYPGILYRNEAPSITSFQQVMEAITPILNIISILSTVQDIVTVAGAGSPVALIIDVIISIASSAISCALNSTRDVTSTLYYNMDFNSINPLPAQFKRVEVIPNSGDIGKTVHEFTNADDYAIWEPTNEAMSMKQRFAYWAYGLPKLTTIYDVSGNKVHQAENVYDTSYAREDFKIPKNLNKYRYESCKCLVTKNSSQRNTDWADAAHVPPGLGPNYNDDYSTSSYNEANDGMEVQLYHIISGRFELKDTYERVYKPGNQAQYLETKTSYTYNYKNYQAETITTTQSNGDLNYKNIKYTIDCLGGVNIVLVNNNIISLPVETATAVSKDGGVTYEYLSETVTEYSITGNGDIKPSRTLERRFSRPQAVNNFYLAPNNPGNPADYTITQTFTYDNTGNLTGITDEGNRTVSNLYDYNDKYVVASVVNAETISDRPAYSSFENQNTGNWIINGTAAYVMNSVTGTTGFDLSSANLSASLNMLKPYRLTFWATSTILVSGNATLTKLGPAIDGFTYYEYDLASNTSSVSISGSATIDELRVYPATSRMRTVTYDPLVGKTSECDENNRITYFEYDDLGRLRFIKDENKSITKMYEYNTTGKQGGCPMIFSNLAVSEVFTKDNCGTGYMPGRVTYTIPANKYSSTISQADADQKAEDELNRNAHAYANANGECKLIYFNVALSQTFTTESCSAGFAGGAVTYTVPAARYSSVLSQADANEQALDEIEANGQAYANNPQHAVCNTDISPDWWSTGNEQCQADGDGHLTGHQFLQQVDRNPNSATYHQIQWIDLGVNTAACPIPVCNDCTAINRKCINGTCEPGIRVNTASFEVHGGYLCTYHYVWSDGSWSENYNQFSQTACYIGIIID